MEGIILKRFSDILFSLIVLVILSPLLLIISIAIKAGSKGPALFSQRRIGKKNEEFVLYKFRSMRTDTPNVATHLIKDPQQYITTLGKFIRKSSLDELPQLLNILKGDMTFIGPRPALYNQYDLVRLRTSRGVHTLRPGITGWAQVNGRDSLTISEKVELDAYYLKHHDFALDIKILYYTVIKVLRAEGVQEGNHNLSLSESEKRLLSGEVVHGVGNKQYKEMKK